MIDENEYIPKSVVYLGLKLFFVYEDIDYIKTHCDMGNHVSLTILERNYGYDIEDDMTACKMVFAASQISYKIFTGNEGLSL